MAFTGRRTYQILSQKKSYIHLGRVSNKVVQRIVKFHILEFCVFVKMEPYGSKRFKTTSPLKEHTRFDPPNSYILLGRVCTKVVNRLMKFEIVIF